MNAARFSIIINNYNYGRFLARAIRSALEQDAAGTEVIVVDDGSTDNSREVIAGFGEKIRAVCKSNGGQASAFNAGFPASTGQHILFLDSDDALRRDAVTRLAAEAADPAVVKVQARMRLVDENDEPLGAEEPAGWLASGDFKSDVLRLGPSAYPSTPTSACAWSRSFLEKVLPMPEAEYRVAADGYLKNLAPLFGRVASVQEPVVDYRLHGANTSHWGWESDPRGRLARDTAHYETACRNIALWADRLGCPCDARPWIEARWPHLARRHLLHRLGGGAEFRVRWPQLSRAARRPFARVAAALIYLAPTALATPLVMHLFRKKKIGAGLRVTRPARGPGDEAPIARMARIHLF